MTRIAFRTSPNGDGLRLEWSAENLTAGFQVNRMAGESDLDFTAKCHGYKQKIGDAAAIERNPETGKSATVSDKFKAMWRVIENLRDGAWTMRQYAPNEDNLLAMAIAEVSGKPFDKVREYLKSKSKTERTALLATNAKYRAVYERMQAEQTAGVDVESLNAGIEAIEG